MKNFIKKAKIDFPMGSVAHSSFMANAVDSLIRALAFSIVDMLKRAALPKYRKSSHMLPIRTDLVKIDCKAATSAKKTAFKL